MVLTEKAASGRDKAGRRGWPPRRRGGRPAEAAEDVLQALVRA